MATQSQTANARAHVSEPAAARRVRRLSAPSWVVALSAAFLIGCGDSPFEIETTPADFHNDCPPEQQETGCANVNTTETTGSTSSDTSGGIWVSVDSLRERSTSGAAWESVLRDARRDAGRADVSDQDSEHDVYTLAAALACVRIGEPYCEKARSQVVDAIGTEEGGRWLAVGRNLTSYVIAADLLGLRADDDPNSAGSRVEAWIRSFLTKRLAHNNTGEPIPLIPFASGSNASAQEGAAYAAVAAYAGDREALDRAWDAFRTYACDPTAPDREGIDLEKGIAHGWAHDEANACAINPKGTTKRVPDGRPGAGRVVRIDGAIINDMRRGGSFRHEPGYTQYPWVGLEGVVPAAVILSRAGYPAFEVADSAVLRAVDYLHWLRETTGEERWFDGERADEIVHLVNAAYDRDFRIEDDAVGPGRTIGYTDWVHPDDVD